MLALPGKRQEAMIQMSVKALGLDTRSAQPVVLLNADNSDRVLPIWIGAAEAKAIQFALEGLKSARPLTHELLLNVISELGYTVLQVEIGRINRSTYSGTLRLVRKDDPEVEKTIDARASDSIAVAIAADAPIYVSSQVASDATIILQTVEEDEAEEADAMEFRNFISNVKASDFQLPGVSVQPAEDEIDMTPPGTEFLQDINDALCDLDDMTDDESDGDDDLGGLSLHN